MDSMPIINASALSELRRVLGREGARRVTERASAERAQMLDIVDDRGSAVIRAHIERWIVPVAATYVAIRDELDDTERALDLTFRLMRAVPTGRVRALRILRWLPWRFTLFRLAHRRALKRDFGLPGWDCEVIEDSATRLAYVMRSCCYYDIYRQLGLPEVAPLGCKMDEVEYALLPEIRFQRTQTLASGGDCCDFSHFIDR